MQAHRYISNDCLLKLLGSGKKIMMETAHETIMEVLVCTVAPKVLVQLHGQIKSRNAIVRQKNAEYFDIVLSHYPIDILDKYTDIFEAFLSAGVHDQTQEVRSMTRKCYKRFAQLFPNKAGNVFAGMEPQA